MKISVGSFLVVTALLTLTAACGESVGLEGDVVGGPCVDNASCASGSMCLEGGDFPGGTCTTPCSSVDSCPLGSECVDKKGGVCLLFCDYSTDCRSGYKCKGTKRISGDGEVLVCID